MRRGERHGQTGRVVTEFLHDIAVQPLEPVDLAPRRFPAAEVRAQAVRRLGQGGQLVRPAGPVGHVVPHADAFGPRRRRRPGPERFAPEHRQRGFGRGRRPLAIPSLQRRHLRSQSGIWRRLIGRRQRRDQPIKRCQKGVVGLRQQSLAGQPAGAGQHPHGLRTAWVLARCVHVSRERRLFGTVRARRRPRRIVGVEHPARRWVRHLRQTGQRVHAPPVGRRVRPVDRPRVVEAVVTPRDELRVQVGGHALVVGEQGVVGRVGFQLRHFQKAGIVCRLGPQKRLLQRLDRLVHQGDGDPLPLGLAHHRPMVRAVGGERPAGH